MSESESASDLLHNVRLEFDGQHVDLPSFNRSQEPLQLFEKHFPALRAAEFDVYLAARGGKPVRWADAERADVADGATLLALRTADTAGDADEATFFAAYSRMKDPSDGVPVKDRRWLLRTYHDCFTGSDAVAWLVKNGFAKTTDEAVEFGRQMQQRRLLEHVTRDHELKNESLFYRFLDLQDTVSWSTVLPSETDDDDEHSKSGTLQSTLALPMDMMRAAVESLETTPLDEHNIKLLDHVHPPNHKDPKPAKSYNMVVIGAGAAGLVTAAGSAGVGAKVALIERHLLGGDCLNIGCVPSKALLRCAKAVHAARTGGDLGVRIEGGPSAVTCDFGAVMERMRRIRAEIAPNDSVSRFTSLGIDVYIGQAQFTSKSTVAVNGQTLKFAKACIATGARAALPPIAGIDNVKYLTNASVFNLTELPKRFGIIGTGAIGCEMAQAFSRFGSEVTMFARSARVMSREDAEASQAVERALKADGVTLLHQFQYDSVSQDDESGVITVRGSHNGQAQKIELDALLVSTGRVPNVEGLNLEGAGIKYDKRAGVKVTDTLQTSNSNVYAAGDICTALKFTHMADFMARHVIKNALFFGNAKASSLTVPWCTYTQPEVAHVGLYERDMKRRGLKFTTFRRDFDDVDRAICDSSTDGFVKIHVEEGSDKILGATIVAEHAGDMISEITTAMVGGVGLGTLSTVIHPYPTISAAIRECGDAFNRTRLTPTVRILFRKLLAARR